MLEEHGSDEPDDGRFIGKDADDVGAALVATARTDGHEVGIAAKFGAVLPSATKRNVNSRAVMEIWNAAISST